MDYLTPLKSETLWAQDGGMLLRLFNHIAIAKHLLTFPCGGIDNSVPKPRSVETTLKQQNSSCYNLIATGVMFFCLH